MTLWRRIETEDGIEMELVELTRRAERPKRPTAVCCLCDATGAEWVREQCSVCGSSELCGNCVEDDNPPPSRAHICPDCQRRFHPNVRWLDGVSINDQIVMADAKTVLKALEQEIADGRRR